MFFKGRSILTTLKKKNWNKLKKKEISTESERIADHVSMENKISNAKKTEMNAELSFTCQGQSLISS